MGVSERVRAILTAVPVSTEGWVHPGDVCHKTHKPTSFYCTEPKGHDGVHIARYGGGVLCVDCNGKGVVWSA